MPSLTHLLILILVGLVLLAPTKLSGLGRALRLGAREFKKGLRGEEDIDVTDSVKRLPHDDGDGEPKA